MHEYHHILQFEGKIILLLKLSRQHLLPTPFGDLWTGWGAVFGRGISWMAQTRRVSSPGQNYPNQNHLRDEEKIESILR